MQHQIQYVLANRSQGPNALNDTTSELYGMTSYLLESIQSHASRSEVTFEVDVKSTASEPLDLILQFD